MDTSYKVRRHIIFHGRVQGVGFRYYSTNFANAKGLTGWVRNLYDGTVEMEIQGSPRLISELIEYMGMQTFVEIDSVDAKDIPLVTEHGFYEL